MALSSAPALVHVDSENGAHARPRSLRSQPSVTQAAALRGKAQPTFGALSASRLFAVIFGASSAPGAACSAEASPRQTPVEPEVVQVYPHDSAAFTQGLLLHDTFFYESTGLLGRSTLRRVQPATGKVLAQHALADNEFGEGLTRVGESLYQLTWRNHVAYVYDAKTFARTGQFSYEGEGWGLCFDGRELIMSDGSERLFFRDPATFAITRQVTVTLDGVAQPRLNELECVGSLVYANVYLTDRIVRIRKDDGVVLTDINAPNLLTPAEKQAAEVLNGIAFDPATQHFFLTGKNWPKVFEVRFDFPPDGNAGGAGAGGSGPQGGAAGRGGTAGQSGAAGGGAVAGAGTSGSSSGGRVTGGSSGTKNTPADNADCGCKTYIVADLQYPSLALWFWGSAAFFGFLRSQPRRSCHK